MSAIIRRKIPLILLLATLFAFPAIAPAAAQAAKNKGTEKAKALTAVEADKILKFLQKRFREKVVLKPDEDDPESLEVEVGGELLGWVRRDDEGFSDEGDFIFEWYILGVELDE